MSWLKIKTWIKTKIWIPPWIQSWIPSHTFLIGRGFEGTPSVYPSPLFLSVNLSLSLLSLPLSIYTFISLSLSLSLYTSSHLSRINNTSKLAKHYNSSNIYLFIVNKMPDMTYYNNNDNNDNNNVRRRK